VSVPGRSARRSRRGCQCGACGLPGRSGEAEQQQSPIAHAHARGRELVEHALEIALTTAGALAAWAVPIERRMPAWVRRTSDEGVGEGRSAALWACEMTTRRRAMVAAFIPTSASQAR
jgi:hypothetical protein